MECFRHAVPVFLTELQKWLSQNAADTSTKIFEEVQQEEGDREQGGCLVYKLVESSKVDYHLVRNFQIYDNGKNTQIFVQRKLPDILS